MFGRQRKPVHEDEEQELEVDVIITSEAEVCANACDREDGGTKSAADENASLDDSFSNLEEEVSESDVIDEAASNDPRAEQLAESEETSSSQATLEILDCRLSELLDLFKAKIEHSEYELEVARRYSEELQEHRSDLYQSILDPLIRKMVVLAGGMSKAEEMAVQRQEDAVSLDTFSLYREELEEALADFDIEAFAPEIGEAFVSGDHKIVGDGIPTTDRFKARCIAEVRSRGYKSPKKVYAPAKVRVFALECASEDVEVNEDIEQESVGEAETEMSEHS